jgi:tRNA(fMet)-specific endonuclease VapC
MASIIVATKLRHGTTKKASPRLTAQVEAVLSVIDTLPFDSPAIVHAPALLLAVQEALKQFSAPP